MCEERHHIEIEPGCIATFNTPTPHPETIRILKDVIRMAMEKEGLREGVERTTRSGVSVSDGTPATPDGEALRTGTPK